jgi:hypothetical protein
MQILIILFITKAILKIQITYLTSPKNLKKKKKIIQKVHTKFTKKVILNYTVVTQISQILILLILINKKI